MVTNIFIHIICRNFGRNFVNKLFITKMFSAKRTLIFQCFSIHKSIQIHEDKKYKM